MLHPCPTCLRHIRDHACPFCRARQATVIAAISAAGLLACHRPAAPETAAPAEAIASANAPAPSAASAPEANAVAPNASATPETSAVVPSTSVAKAPGSAAPAGSMATIGELVAANPDLNNGIGSVAGLPPGGGVHVAMQSGYGAPPISDRLATAEPERVVTMKVSEAGAADARVVYAAGGRLRRCVASAVAGDRSASGTTTLTLRVTAAGGVSAATSMSAGIPPAAGACVEAVGRGLTFPTDHERVVRVSLTAAAK